MSSVLIYNVENNKSKENTSQKNERCVQTFDWYGTSTEDMEFLIGLGLTITDMFRIAVLCTDIRVHK